MRGCRLRQRFGGIKDRVSVAAGDHPGDCETGEGAGHADVRPQELRRVFDRIGRIVSKQGRAGALPYHRRCAAGVEVRRKLRRPWVPAIRSTAYQRSAAGPHGGCRNRQLQLCSAGISAFRSPPSTGLHATWSGCLEWSCSTKPHRGSNSRRLREHWRVRRNSLLPNSIGVFPRSIPGWATIRPA